MDGFMQTLGVQKINPGASHGMRMTGPGPGGLVISSPIDGKPIGSVTAASAEDYETVMSQAVDAFQTWRHLPAPKRGEVIRLIGEQLRAEKESLGKLVTLETGKSLGEGLGEVQEMIDICDFAVGLSRQLYGATMQSERPRHRMYEQWLPLGVIGVITSFNFPAAVWAWNAALAAVAGDTVIWKPSSKTPLSAIAVQNIVNRVAGRMGLQGVFNLVIGSGEQIGERMISDARLPLISATGSSAMGARVGQVVASRFGRTILELGGNNAVIVTGKADLALALKAVLFGALGTAGQRCTTTRRLILHRSIAERFLAMLVDAYGSVRIGNPFDETTTMGPLIDGAAAEAMMLALEKAAAQGGEIVYGGRRLGGGAFPGGAYVQPAIVRVDRQIPVVRQETFAPILYALTYDTLEEAVALNNDVPQGLSSSIFTQDLAEAEAFLDAAGSDCGIANVNVATIGAEIGGAFGGEKATGGGREAGSDAWKAYMRRQTVTVNWGSELPLAQGIRFGRA